ncbi:hypothetical protein ABTZ59_29710 [Streptomyces sp. NPDC094034]|uniref:hypothetical protein n=1 Tax=Streptomyces sp. NPDC094034 TaxID=3155309 RepID=UPI003328D404
MGVSFRKPETASGEDRVADLDEVTVGALLSHKLRQDAEHEQWGEAYADHGLVFAREDGDPLRPDDATKLVAELVDAAGLRRIRPHIPRHEQATQPTARRRSSRGPARPSSRHRPTTSVTTR